MDTLFLMVVCGVGFVVAYNTYGRFLGSKIFRLNPDAPVPSRELNDGVDYIPTRKGIIFGHHFTSIAGTGPIVGGPRLRCVDYIDAQRGQEHL